MNKIFDINLYNESDNKAKRIVHELLYNTGFYILENNNKFGVDLDLFYKGKYIAYLECERKFSWNTDNFPFKTVNFPERKKKFVGLDYYPTIFIMFNKDFHSFLMVDGKNIINSPLNEVPNKYIKKGEKFFQVPVELAYFNNINALTKLIM